MTEAERAYAAQQNDPEERNRLVLQELPQVHFIAHRIHERLPAHVPLEDLVQAGVIGLIDALRNYDATKGVQLRAFAQHRIRGAILDSLRDLDWGSRRVRQKGRFIDEKLTALTAKLGRQPTDEELAAEAGLSLQELHDILTKLDGMHMMGQRFESSFLGEDDQDLIESAPAGDNVDPLEIYAQTELNEQLATALGTLSEKERLVLSLYYKDELTMREISLAIGLAQSRVSQIHAASVAKLRNALQHRNAQPVRAGRSQGRGKNA